MVHKQVDDTGHVTYTDRPDLTPSPSPLPRMTVVSALDVARALAANMPISSRGAAMVDASEAARRLRRAQRERELGAEPLPGEQAPGVDVHAVNDRYRQRQERLRRAVEQAQRRSSQLRAPLRTTR
jgi:hypothetical protein